MINPTSRLLTVVNIRFNIMSAFIAGMITPLWWISLALLLGSTLAWLITLGMRSETRDHLEQLKLRKTGWNYIGLAFVAGLIFLGTNGYSNINATCSSTNVGQTKIEYRDATRANLYNDCMTQFTFAQGSTEADVQSRMAQCLSISTTLGNDKDK